jgi:hypothetical protein
MIIMNYRFRSIIFRGISKHLSNILSICSFSPLIGTKTGVAAGVAAGVTGVAAGVAGVTVGVTGVVGFNPP